MISGKAAAHERESCERDLEEQHDADTQSQSVDRSRIMTTRSMERDEVPNSIPKRARMRMETLVM